MCAPHAFCWHSDGFNVRYKSSIFPYECYLPLTTTNNESYAFPPTPKWVARRQGPFSDSFSHFVSLCFFSLSLVLFIFVVLFCLYGKYVNTYIIFCGKCLRSYIKFHMSFHTHPYRKKTSKFLGVSNSSSACIYWRHIVSKYRYRLCTSSWLGKFV